VKNVLLLGDSIRMEYQPLVKDALKRKANVFGPLDNGRWSGYTLNSLRFWSPFVPDADIVHWNNGIWDLGDDYNLGRHFSLPDEYRSNLVMTIQVLKQLYGNEVVIIMATTTPIKGRDSSELCKYNDILRDVAGKYNAELDDLYGDIIKDIDSYIGDDNVHPTVKGKELLAQKVTETIIKHL